MPTTPAADAQSTVETPTGGLAAKLEALEVRFVGLEDDELMMRLKDVVREHLVRIESSTDEPDDATTDER